ncbi:NlpC/P60 family protein [Streptacidiphilus melanogenes]|uniref:NlpC/P60 family protein n=1 Tax=Streptacidiphilus melanogenes TaxID=411235 RepID=UPI0005A5DAC3|nr:NlpC/P60 family protein [Streptacidiphilus melanogenes]
MSSPLSRRRLLAGAGGVALAGTAAVLGYELNKGKPVASGPSLGSADASSDAPTTQSGYRFQRQSSPGRTVVQDGSGNQLAVFTDGARTAVLAGPSRTFSEPSTTQATVTTSTWVRVLPKAWKQGQEKSAWFTQWFPKALHDTSPDVLGVAFEYSSAGAASHYDSAGVRYAGRAHFGPRNPGVTSSLDFGYHDEKSDFYDYLGIPWTFSDGTHAQPEKDRYGDADCSGFQRLVWGYRMGIPMHNTNTAGVGLPRRAYAIAAAGPGVLLIPNTGAQATDLSVLQPGDLVFFAIRKDQPSVIDHCGMYLGPDNAGRPRFYSSRSAADGPTMGDLAGHALLDGTDFYARGFRSARRL